MKSRQTLRNLLNYSFLNYTNKTHSCGEKDLPALYCKAEVYPDFLALYSEPSLYHKTDRTGVCFYQFDSVFDGKRGLYEAIYHDDTARLAYFKKRFEGVKFFIAPDYSEFGDIHVIENEYRLFKARVVAIWLAIEIGAIVIPNISFPTERSAAYALDGYEECSVVAINTKSHLQDKVEYERLLWKIRFTVDHLKLIAIVVYDACGTNDRVMECFAFFCRFRFWQSCCGEDLFFQRARAVSYSWQSEQHTSGAVLFLSEISLSLLHHPFIFYSLQSA